MKAKLLSLFSAITTLIIIMSCNSTPKQSQESKNVLVPIVKYEVTIDGMTCSGCEQTIHKAVSGLNGVEEVTVSHEKGSAIIKIHEGMFDSLAISSLITKSGYSVVGFENLSKE
jgi:copper chaperone CopZ